MGFLVAFAIAANPFVNGTMLERLMTVPNILKIMHLLRLEHERSCERMNRRVSPSLEMCTTQSIKVGKEVAVFTTAVKVHVCNLKVGPEVTKIPRVAKGIAIAKVR